MLLSILWLACCLPVITAGASTLALFAVAHKMAAGQDYFVRRDFFKAFRRDFRQATVTWLPMLGLAVLLVLDGALSASLSAPWGGRLRGVAAVAWVVWAVALLWGPALLARFTYAKGSDALKNGLVLALHTPAAAALTALLLCWPPALLALLPELFLYLIPFLLFVIPGASAWGIARAMRPAVAALEHKNHYFLDREDAQ